MVLDSEGPPPGWRQATLEELLPEEALKKLAPIMNRIRRGKLDDMTGQREILKILEDYRQELEGKGVLPEYLSYVLLAMSLKGPGGQLGKASIA